MKREASWTAVLEGDEVHLPAAPALGGDGNAREARAVPAEVAVSHAHVDDLAVGSLAGSSRPESRLCCDDRRATHNNGADIVR